jgi:hypothetical protein
LIRLCAGAAWFIFRLVILLPPRSVYRKRKIEYKEGVDYMFTTKGYAAHSALEPLKPFSFERREPTPTDVQIEILFCGVCHLDLHIARNEWGVIGDS